MAAAATGILGREGAAQKAGTPIPIEMLLTAPTLGDVASPTFSPDGTLLAYTAIDTPRRPAFDQERSYRFGVPSYAVGGGIWVTRLQDGVSRILTDGGGNHWAPSWSPDGRRLAFLSDRAEAGPAGQTHLWIWERASGQLRQASELPIMDPWGRLGRLEWLRDSRTVLVKTYPAGVSPEAYARLIVDGQEKVRPSTERGLTVRLFSFDPADDSIPRADPNNLTGLLGVLALIDVETGAVRRLTSGERICSYSLSPDGQALAWAVATRFQRPGSHQILADLKVQSLQTGVTRQMVADAPLVDGYPNFPLFSWSPNSRAIAYRTSGVETRDEIYVVPTDSGAPRRVAEGPVRTASGDEGRPLWDPLGEQVYFLRNGAIWRAPSSGTGARLVAEAPDRRLWLIERNSSMLWTPEGPRTTTVFTVNPTTKRNGRARVDLTSGRITQLIEEDKKYALNVATAPLVTPDGKAVVYVTEDPSHPPNFWLARGASETQPRQLTGIGAELTAFGAADSKLIRWRSLDGDTLRGALIYPIAYKPGRRYPLIVKVYGGTDVSDDLNRFGFAATMIENLHVFASRGYALLLAESRLHVGTPMLDLAKTVLPGVDRIVQLGIADPDRIGITGHSYGGYNTLALIVQSGRFRAAAMRAGFGDLIAAYGGLSPDGTNYLVPWAERGQGRMGATPWEARERYLENSPIHYLDRVQTPLLIIHGGEDSPFLADQVFTGLRRLGKRVEYARYEGEGHWEGIWSLQNQLDYLKRIVRWFDLHLKAGAASHTSYDARDHMRN